MTLPRALSFLLPLLLLAGLAEARPLQITGPAITVVKIGVNGSNTDDFAYYGQAGGIAAYSIATTSCNPGTQVVQWTSSDHPVISTNIFRLKNGRFEQLGQSWLKHGFCAVNEPDCGTCQSTSCATLGIGCADTYWATLNDGQGGGPKYQVNATTGTHQHPYPSPTGPSTIRGRLQVLVSEIDPSQNAGALYFSEAQYVSQHTAQNGNGHLANSWRKLNVIAVNNIDGGGPTRVGQPAPYAWKAEDVAVTVLDVYNPGEGAGPGARWCVAYKVSDLGGGTWRYDYVVENISSDRSGYSFAVPVGGNLSSPFFRDVAYHSGEPFANTDWVSEELGGMYRWRSTQTHAENVNANALRWGTMYTFGFEADAPPQAAMAEIQMFKPTGGGSNTLLVPVQGPSGCPLPGIAAQPQSQDACPGNVASFSVSAIGTGPFTYQWYKDGGVIGGATGDQYTIPSVAPGDAGNYTVEITNGCGTTPSDVAVLDVLGGPPTIDSPPMNQSVCAGGTATFSVTATGPGMLSYQWLDGGGPIPGATSSSYSIPNTTTGHAGSYSVQVSNACATVPGGAATLLVADGPPTITRSPQSEAVCVGGSVVLNVGASGGGTFTYQWYHQGKDIPGANASSYSIPSAAPSDAGLYLATVSNECGTGTSSQALLNVNSTSPSIDLDPQSATVCQGGDAFFYVMASGSTPLGYQWYHRAMLIPGATDSSYYVLSAGPSDAGEYTVEVTNACSSEVSAPALLEVLPPGCVIGSGLYEVTGPSSGADWCLRVTHCDTTAQVVVPGLAVGASAADLAQAFAAAVESLSPLGGCNVGAQVTPPGSATFKITWAGGSLTLEVGEAGCGSFCTVTTMTACSFNPILTQVGESVLEPGQALCFCDGGHTDPPCANAGGIPAGCLNSSGLGASLFATGSDSVIAGDAVLHVTGAIPNQPGLFFQGTSAIANGDGVPFGDGHRCCGVSVTRLQVVVPDANGNAATSVGLAASGGATAGDNRCYQYWYRDSAGPCSSTFNLTNGYVVSWSN